MNSISAAISARRVDLGITQTEVSKRSGISQASISDIEAGSTPRRSTLAKIAVALECEPLDLDPNFTADGRNNRTRRSDAKRPTGSADPEMLLVLDSIAGQMTIDFGFVPSHLQVVQFLAKKAGFVVPTTATPDRSGNP